MTDKPKVIQTVQHAGHTRVRFSNGHDIEVSPRGRCHWEGRIISTGPMVSMARQAATLERIVNRAITVVVDNLHEVSKENPTIVSLDRTLDIVRERWAELANEDNVTMDRYAVKYYDTVIGYAQSVGSQWIPGDMNGRQLPGGPFHAREDAEMVVRQNWDDKLAVVFGIE